jgi:hypothetical protein
MSNKQFSYFKLEGELDNRVGKTLELGNDNDCATAALRPGLANAN